MEKEKVGFLYIELASLSPQDIERGSVEVQKRISPSVAKFGIETDIQLTEIEGRQVLGLIIPVGLETDPELRNSLYELLESTYMFVCLDLGIIPLE